MRKLSAQSLIEYGLLLVLVVGIVSVALVAFGSTLSGLFASVQSAIDAAL